VSRARLIARLLGAAVSRPRLALRLAGAAWRFRRRRWYARPPFLPLPPPEYVDWRLETAYGEAVGDVPIAPVRGYLEWSAAQARAARGESRARGAPPATWADPAAAAGADGRSGAGLGGFIRVRALLVIVVLLAAILAIPPVREVAGPVFEPGKAVLDRTVGRVWVRGRDQVFRWSVRNEARTLALELQKREVSGQPLPRPQDFQAYLERRTISGTPGLDKWGSPYYMLVAGDSITVVSPGPDARPGTADDIREAVARNR
jgi:hypothetical protein